MDLTVLFRHPAECVERGLDENQLHQRNLHHCCPGGAAGERDGVSYADGCHTTNRGRNQGP